MIKRNLKIILKRFGYKLEKIDNNLVVENVKTKPKSYDALNGDSISPFNMVPFAAETLQYLVTNYDFESILDIGSGEGLHSDVLLEVGKKVTSIDFGNSIYFNKRSTTHDTIIDNYYEHNFEKKFDAIWASHVLEHQPNPNFFLKKIFRDLKENGVLALTVPPLKHDIVGGHVTLWNAGLLMYQLILAGFNCRDISIKSYGYNISVVLNKVSIESYPELSYDSGDILKLADYFPEGINEPFEGRIKELNWL